MFHLEERERLFHSINKEFEILLLKVTNRPAFGVVC